MREANTERLWPAGHDTITLPVPDGCLTASAIRYIWYDT